MYQKEWSHFQLAEAMGLDVIGLDPQHSGSTPAKEEPKRVQEDELCTELCRLLSHGHDSMRLGRRKPLAMCHKCHLHHLHSLRNLLM